MVVDLRVHTEEFVRSYFDAWNHHDPEGIAHHLGPEGIYIDIPEHSTRSPDELVDRLREFFRQYWHEYELTGEILQSDNNIAFQYRIHSQQHGTCQGAEFVTLNGDTAVAITDYYDLPESGTSRKYSKSGLSDEQLLKYKQALDEIMGVRKAYLQPDLSMPKLAELVGCSINHLSQVINHGYGKSFYGYLNHHRIEYAKELLTRADNRHTHILDIAFNVGFNSNSTFYSAFRKRVGVSPARYRKKKMNKLA
jgi:AraC-like DNA-binding protein